MRKYRYIFILILIFAAALDGAQTESAPAQQSIPGDRAVYVPLLLDTFTCAAVEQLTFSECEALEDLYWATNGHDEGGIGWQNTSGWVDSLTPCAWYGIKQCAYGHVTTMELHSNHLTGALPPAIGEFAQLRRLTLFHNQLASVAPEIGNLDLLEELFLGDNVLTTLPSGIGDLAQLKYLALDANQLSALPAEIGNLANLQNLHLASNRLTALPVTIGNLGNLMVFDLDDNQLTTLPESLVDLVNLTYLGIDHNCLGNLSDPVLVAFLDAKAPGWKETQRTDCPVPVDGTHE